MKILGKLLEVAGASIKTRLTYKMSVWSSAIVNIGQIAILYFIWMSVYGSNSSMNGISKSQIITYVILSNLIFMQITWGLNLTISDKITSGQISIELLRPLDFELYYFMQRLGEFFVSLIIESLPVIIFLLIFLHITLPSSAVNLIAFALSLILAASISFLIEYIVGLFAFYTTHGWGLQITKSAIISFFSGALVPISFFPNWLMHVASILPFKNMLYVPISIYLGTTSGIGILVALLSQLIWIVILLAVSRLFFYNSIKKVTVMGG